MLPVNTLREVSLDAFRSGFVHAQPMLLPRYLQGHHTLPALEKWFLHPTIEHPRRSHLNRLYLGAHGDSAVPVEWTRYGPLVGDRRPVIGFSRAELPLRTFVETLVDRVEGPQDQKFGQCVDGSFYLAQCPIQSLDPRLQEDLPTPDFVQRAGRGDIYENSIWLGLAPTFTPIHKDPNPNFFLQMAGCKEVRLFTPELGLAIVHEALQHLRRGSSTRLDDGMMQGEQREVLYQLAWESERVNDSDQVFEATLVLGDGIFIPKGWWHSLRGVGGGMNGSVRRLKSSGVSSC